MALGAIKKTMKIKVPRMRTKDLNGIMRAFDVNIRW